MDVYIGCSPRMQLWTVRASMDSGPWACAGRLSWPRISPPQQASKPCVCARMCTGVLNPVRSSHVRITEPHPQNRPLSEGMHVSDFAGLADSAVSDGSDVRATYNQRRPFFPLLARGKNAIVIRCKNPHSLSRPPPGRSRSRSGRRKEQNTHPFPAPARKIVHEPYLFCTYAANLAPWLPPLR